MKKSENLEKKTLKVQAGSNEKSDSCVKAEQRNIWLLCDSLWLSAALSGEQPASLQCKGEGRLEGVDMSEEAMKGGQRQEALCKKRHKFSMDVYKITSAGPWS